ncbi:MAG: tetratricopeptide repeat protein [Acidobacteriota bacterium]
MKPGRRRKPHRASSSRAVPAAPPESLLARPALPALLLAAATFLVFAGVFRNDFVSYDDEAYVVRNAHVRAGLSAANVGWAFTSREASNWHPLTWLSHMADVSLFGLSPAGHHFTSLLFHSINVALVFLLLRAATGRTGRSAAAALLFGLHPLRVESVAWIAERKDVLSACLGLLAIAAWARWSRSRNRGAYACSLILFAASLMAKATLVTLPLLLLVLDFWPLRRFGTPPRDAASVPAPGTRSLLVEKIPYAVLAIAGGWLALRAQRAGGATSALALSAGLRLENAVVSIVRYLALTIWPAKLAVFYPHPAAALGWRTWGALALLAAISAAVWVARRSRPYLLAGWLWYLIALAPVLGIVQVGWQGLADRYTYLPSLGLAVAAAWGAASLLEGRLPARALAAAAGVIVLALSALTIRQVATWRDSLTLYGHAIAVTGPNETMQIDLGNELARRGRSEEASRHLQEALRIAPGSRDALYALGSLSFAEGRPAEARSRFEEATRLHPDFAEAFVQIGVALVREGRPKDAVAPVEQALSIRHGLPEALYVLGSALDAQGEAVEAEKKYEAAIAAKPDYPEAHLNLADLLAAGKRYREAIPHYEEALRLKPRFREAQQGLEAARRRAGL